MYFILLSVPLCMIYHVKNKDADELNSPYARHRYGFLFNLIVVEKSPNAKYFTPVFLLRRLFYCTIPLLLCNIQSITIEVMILCHVLYTIVYGVWLDMPH